MAFGLTGWRDNLEVRERQSMPSGCLLGCGVSRVRPSCTYPSLGFAWTQLHGVEHSCRYMYSHCIPLRHKACPILRRMSVPENSPIVASDHPVSYVSHLACQFTGLMHRDSSFSSYCTSPWEHTAMRMDRVVGVVILLKSVQRHGYKHSLAKPSIKLSHVEIKPRYPIRIPYSYI